MAQTATDLRAAAHDISARNGVPPALFVKQIQQESGFNPDAHNDASGADGIAQVVVRWHSEMEGRTRDPLASLEYAARLMAGYYRQTGSWRRALAAYNWGIGNVVGYTKTDGTVVAPWDGRRETTNAETRRYLDVILGEGWPEPPNRQIDQLGKLGLRVTEDGVRLRSGPGTDSRILATLTAGAEAVPLTDHAWRQVNVGGQAGWVAADYLTSGADSTENLNTASRSSFDPETPTYYQRQDWTCSIASVIWMLRSIGIDVTPEEAQDAMSPRYVNPTLGLLDGSGAGIVEVLREHWGVKAHTLDRPGGPTFDDVLAVAGKQPVAIGGRNWGGPGLGHWSAVRGRYEDTLILANPARGDRFGQTTLTRQDWQRLGGFSAVVVDL